MKLKNTICFIINPISGGKKKTGLVKFLNEEFGKRGYNIKIHYTRYPSHAYEHAKKEAVGLSETIVAVGGDGTINEVARGVLDSGKKLGIIPFGSGNGFARHFGIPLNYRKAVNILLNNEAKAVDVAYLNGQEFFCTSGTGFDAETGYVFRNFMNRGFSSYFFSFLKTFREYKPGSYKIMIDGKVIETDAFFINVANISQYGYHFYVAPGASASDGYLDLVILKSFPRWKAPILILRSFLGNIDRSKYILNSRGREITITEPVSRKIVHVDGEAEYMEGELKYSLKTKALNLIYP